jgi:hypothetical protein
MVICQDHRICTCIHLRIHLYQRAKRALRLLHTLVSRDKELTKSDTSPAFTSLTPTSTLCYPLLHYYITPLLHRPRPRCITQHYHITTTTTRHLAHNTHTRLDIYTLRQY